MKKISYLLVLLSCFFYSALPTQAANVFDGIKSNLNTFRNESGLTKADDPVAVVIGIINTILSFLALIFIVMILYGGFSYLTAGGSQDKAKKAQEILKNSTIGVAIILLSAVFVNFVITAILQAMQ